ncbi:MAG: RsmE family RNA methyltransferase, partial [Magnetococcales bacterium]|nr:RsmE family RNA methyltransferase [Magnetococcales bacterium]
MLCLTDPPTGLEQAACLTPDSLPRLAQWQARVGSLLTVFDGQGGYYRGRLLDEAGNIHLFQRLPAGVEPLAPRLLWQAIPDKERMLWIIQKAVELGVGEIQPVMTQHSNHQPRPQGGKPSQDKSTIWAKTALEAARQCRRAILPPIHPPLP